jgi:hypothetical protein
VMKDVRLLPIALLTVLVSACNSPPKQSGDSEIAAMESLKHRYPELVSGFEVRPPTTLTVSINLQNYIEADDTEIAAMKRDALARWRAVWLSAHPREHAMLHVRFIDFIGRKVATETTNV